jgi:hypothetical protein
MNRLGDCPSYFSKRIDSPSYTALLSYRGGKPALRERGFTKITIAWPGGYTSSDWSVEAGSAVKSEWDGHVVGKRANIILCGLV